MPNVAMNGGILKRAISEPLTRPQRAPIAKAARTGTSTGTSRPGNLISAQSSRCARLAATTAARARTDPEDRSMPPVMMTMVTPMAIRPTTEIWRTMLSRLRAVRKAGDKKVMAISMPKRIKTMAYLRIKALKRSRLTLLASVTSVVVCIRWFLGRLLTGLFCDAGPNEAGGSHRVHSVLVDAQPTQAG